MKYYDEDVDLKVTPEQRELCFEISGGKTHIILSMEKVEELSAYLSEWVRENYYS